MNLLNPVSGFLVVQAAVVTLLCIKHIQLGMDTQALVLQPPVFES